MDVPKSPEPTESRNAQRDVPGDFFSIVHMDDDLLVINKRPAVLTMGQSRTEPSVLSSVAILLGATESEPAPFVAIIGRLDHPVSGLLVVAKNSTAADRLWSQLESRVLKKRYEAIVHGSLPSGRQELMNWIVKSKRRRHVDIVNEESEDAQRAVLTYQLMEPIGDYSKISIELKTGRKHQIRSQLAHQGNPIVGDHKYGSREKFPKGIALSCCELQFQHPRNGEALRFDLEEPETWNEWRKL